MIETTFSRIGWVLIGIGAAFLLLALVLGMAGAAQARECLSRPQLRAAWGGAIHKAHAHCWVRDRSAKVSQRKGRAAPEQPHGTPVAVVNQPDQTLPISALTFPITLPSMVVTEIGYWEPPATVLAFAPAGWEPTPPVHHAAALAPVGLGAAAAVFFGISMLAARASLGRLWQATLRPTMPVPVSPLRPAPPDRCTPVPAEFARRILRPRPIARFEPEAFP